MSERILLLKRKVATVKAESAQFEGNVLGKVDGTDEVRVENAEDPASVHRGQVYSSTSRVRVFL